MAILCKYVHKKIKVPAKKCTCSIKMQQKTAFLINGKFLDIYGRTLSNHSINFVFITTKN
jgi:hypothetical protein